MSGAGFNSGGWFWFGVARLAEWWRTDVWGWAFDVPCSDPSGGHCTGRRTGQSVYCRDCDGPRPSRWRCGRCRRFALSLARLEGGGGLQRAVCARCLRDLRFHIEIGRLRVVSLGWTHAIARWWRRWEVEIAPRPDWDSSQVSIIDWRRRECHTLDIAHGDAAVVANALIERGRIPRQRLRLEYGGSVCQVLDIPAALRHRLYDLLLALSDILATYDVDESSDGMQKQATL